MSGNNGSCQVGSAQVEVLGVTRVYRVPGRPPVFALKDCTLTVERGKLTVLVGPSGCGKTTLASILAGYDSPDAGQATLNGQPIKGPGPDRLMVFQETALWPWMTVMKNTVFGPTMSRRLARAEAESRGMRLLDKVGLRDFKDKYPAQLSGGMQRRAELCRALVNDPAVMILDEPFRGLDVMTRELMQEYLIRLFEETGMTMLFITAEIEEALFLADRILVMTNLPGAISKCVEVDLPRPRDYHVLASQRYLEIKAEVMEALYAEGAKAFGKLSAFEMPGACAPAAGQGRD